ncbi:MAG: hypothetical protein IJ664_04635 [Clostridia bacterium]|nr:hypothetical protein [Clostridia bacterium]
MTDSPVNGKYSPAQTQAVKAETIGDIVAAQARLLEKAPTKTDLNDLQAVKTVLSSYMQECACAGCLPTFEGAAAMLGFSRRGLYDRLERYPDSELAAYLDRMRTMWTAMRIAAADRGAVGETLSIFLLLNSSQGFSNQHQIQIEQPAAPLPSATESDAARRRILEALPEWDGDD